VKRSSSSCKSYCIYSCCFSQINRLGILCTVCFARQSPVCCVINVCECVGTFKFNAYTAVICSADIIGSNIFASCTVYDVRKINDSCTVTVIIAIALFKWDCSFLYFLLNLFRCIFAVFHKYICTCSSSDRC